MDDGDEEMAPYAWIKEVEEDYYKTLCTICYENKDDVKPSCEQCQIQLCMSCWYAKCKTFCPICHRTQLNHPRMCQLCFRINHMKDLTICSTCNRWTCTECDTNEYHSCASISTKTEDLIELRDAISVFLLFYRYKLRWNDFHVLGKFIFDVGEVVMLKDQDDKGKEVIVAIYDLTSKKKIFNKVCRGTSMKKYYIGDLLMRGVKTYTPYNRYSFDHMTHFIEKMRMMRVCVVCQNDLSVCGKGYCMNCIRKQRFFYRWMYQKGIRKTNKHELEKIPRFIVEDDSAYQRLCKFGNVVQ